MARDSMQGQFKVTALSYLCAQIYERHPGSKQQLSLGSAGEEMLQYEAQDAGAERRRRKLGQLAEGNAVAGWFGRW